jgi:hypothetical protein
MDFYHIYSVIKYKYVGVSDERNALVLLQCRGPYLNRTNSRTWLFMLHFSNNFHLFF